MAPPPREVHSENGNIHITENPIQSVNGETTRTEIRKSQSVKGVRFKSYSLRDKRLGTRV